MFEIETKLYRFMSKYCHSLVADIDDAQLAEQPYPGANPPGWILGHLAICTDFAVQLLGGRIACPKEWHRMFSPGTTPPQDRAAYPSKAELVEAYERGHERVIEAVGGASEEALNAPHSVEILRGTPLETVRDVIAHLMTTHEATHLGQLSAWRRQLGFGAILNIPRKN